MQCYLPEKEWQFINVDTSYQRWEFFFYNLSILSEITLELSGAT